MTAVLVVPLGEKQESFIIRFDPETGLLRSIDSMRYHEATSTAKTLWLNNVLNWTTVGDFKGSSRGALTLLDEGRPWAMFTVEELVYNVGVEDYIRVKGP